MFESENEWQKIEKVLIPLKTYTNMKDIKRGITSGRKCVLSSDFTTKWEIMFMLDIISMLGLTRRAYASKDMCYTMFITTEYVIHSTLGLVH